MIVSDFIFVGKAKEKKKEGGGGQELIKDV